MKIKNTHELALRAHELVLRARGHARQDHILQGTYGEGSTNGHVEFQGCAIGCLATPHRQSELRSFIKSIGQKVFNVWESNEAGSGQVPRLAKEFGISPALARCAEAIFEALPAHGGAIEFIPRFAAALNEGANITPAKLQRAWPAIIDDSAAEAIEKRAVSRDYYVDGPLPGQAVAAADRFIAWLKEQR